MRGRRRLIAAGGVLLAILVLLSGFHRVKVIQFEAGPNAVNLPFGTTRDAVGRAVGIDGRVYGPLTFAASGHALVLADTYRQRLLTIEGGRMTEIPTLNQLVEDVQMGPKNRIFVADNRGLAVWMIAHGRRTKLMQFRHRPGYSEALWHLAVGENRKLYLEMVRFGHGIFSAQLDEYSITGRFVRRLAEAAGGRTEPLTSLSNSLVSEPVRNFQVSPQGELYVEPASLPGKTRTVTVYSSDGRFLRRIELRCPEPLRHAELLGVSRQGWIYLGANLTDPHQARVIVANGDGHIIGNIHVSAVSVHATTYGRVLPSGLLYLDQSSGKRYRIATYRPVVRRVWRWTGF